MPQKQKRPVYVVVKDLGVRGPDNEEHYAIIEIKTTQAAASTLARQVGGRVVKKFLT